MGIRLSMRSITPLLATVAVAAVTWSCNHGPTTVAGAPVGLSIESGNDPLLTAGTSASDTLTVKVHDVNGLGVSGVTVSWSLASPPDGSLSATSSVSDSEGDAEVLYTPGTQAGLVSVTATASSFSPVTFSISLIASSAAELVKVSGDGQSAAPGSTLSAPLVVRVTDAYGNSVPGVQVTWTASDGGTFNPATSTSDTSGHASTMFTLGPGAGARTITASSVNLQAVSFSLTGT